MATESEPSPEDRAPTWKEEQLSIGFDYDGIFEKIADAAAIPPHEGVTWHAAVVTMVGRDESGQTVSYLQYAQDAAWKVSERDVLRYMIRLVRARIGI